MESPENHYLMFDLRMTPARAFFHTPHLSLIYSCPILVYAVLWQVLTCHVNNEGAN